MQLCQTRQTVKASKEKTTQPALLASNVPGRGWGSWGWGDWPRVAPTQVSVPSVSGHTPPAGLPEAEGERQQLVVGRGRRRRRGAGEELGSGSRPDRRRQAGCAGATVADASPPRRTDRRTDTRTDGQSWRRSREEHAQLLCLGHLRRLVQPTPLTAALHAPPSLAGHDP